MKGLKPSEKYIYTMMIDRAQRIKDWDREALKGFIYTLNSQAKSPVLTEWVRTQETEQLNPQGTCHWNLYTSAADKVPMGIMPHKLVSTLDSTSWKFLAFFDAFRK